MVQALRTLNALPLRPEQRAVADVNEDGQITVDDIFRLYFLIQ